MNKKLNNTNFRNLLSKSLEIKEKKRMTWIEYFNQPFFKEEIKDDYEPPKELEENYREPEERESQQEQKSEPDLKIEPLNLNEEEKEILKEIDEKQEELIKDNVKKNLNPDEDNNDRKNLIIEMIEVGTMYANKINLIKKNNPNYFLNIDEIIKDENHVYFPISLLAKSLEKNGILTAVEHNDNVSEDELFIY
jgi:serine/threonine protein kinase